MVWLLRTSAKVFVLAAIFCVGMMIGSRYDNPHLARFSSEAQEMGEGAIRFGIERWPGLQKDIDDLTKRVEASMRDS